MPLALLLMRVLETIFFLGVAGSSIVVILSFVEDIQELFGKDDEVHGAAVDETL